MRSDLPVRALRLTFSQAHSPSSAAESLANCKNRPGRFLHSTEGLGIGLPLVKRIAEYHGGTAFAESAGESAELGATFVIELPADVREGAS